MKGKREGKREGSERGWRESTERENIPDDIKELQGKKQ